MKVAVLSGKGGAGKTLVATGLACAAGRAVYIDCDVEEPNAHILLKGDVVATQTVSMTSQSKNSAPRNSA